jgi:hypothetical protein
VTFDWTITLGNLISIIGFIGLGTAVFYGMRSDIAMLSARVGGVEADLNKIDESLKPIVKIFVEIARQDERMSSMDRRLNDLANRVLQCERRDRYIPPHHNPEIL